MTRPSKKPKNDPGDGLPGGLTTKARDALTEEALDLIRGGLGVMAATTRVGAASTQRVREAAVKAGLIDESDGIPWAMKTKPVHAKAAVPAFMSFAHGPVDTD